MEKNNIGNFPLGRITSIETANRTLAVRQGGALVTRFAYDPLRGMVTEIKTVKGSTFLQNLNYSYDNFGNLASRKDNTLDILSFSRNCT